jgi:ABC-2 type transport system permease protein
MKTQLSMPHLVSSEWLKLRSMRSFWWGVTAAIVLGLAGGLILAFGFTADNPPTVQEAPYVIFNFAAAGAQIGVLIVAVLAVSTEYSTGSIRLTFVAAPARLRVMVAKALVVMAVTAVVAVLTLPLAYAEVVPRMGSIGVHPATGDIVSAFTQQFAYLILVAMFAFGLTLAVRSTAAGVGIGIAVVTAVPGVLAILSNGLRVDLAKLGFTRAAHSLLDSTSSAGVAAVSALTVLVWLAVPLGYGGVALVRKDA